mgnify:CR=1 FL=1|tara:strand:- start:1190 stop:1462 length:273 start_codon:yes stop_codon:yes gene_type:complete
MGAMKNLLIKQQEEAMNRDNYTETELQMLKGTSEHQVTEAVRNLLDLGVSEIEVLKLFVLALEQIRPGWHDAMPELRHPRLLQLVEDDNG